jgi:hypothetical protein
MDVEDGPVGLEFTTRSVTKGKRRGKKERRTSRLTTGMTLARHAASLRRRLGMIYGDPGGRRSSLVQGTRAPPVGFSVHDNRCI